MDKIDQKVDVIITEIENIVLREVRCECDEDIVIAFKSAAFLLDYIVKNKFTLEDIELLRNTVNYNYNEFEAEYYG